MFDMRDARATKMQMTDGSAYIKAERKRAAYRTKKKKNLYDCPSNLLSLRS